MKCRRAAVLEKCHPNSTSNHVDATANLRVCVIMTVCRNNSLVRNCPTLHHPCRQKEKKKQEVSATLPDLEKRLDSEKLEKLVEKFFRI